MRRKHRLGEAKFAFGRQKERLSTERPLSLAVLFIPFLVTIVLSLYTSLETASRLRAVGKPLERAGSPNGEHEVWLSLAARDGELLITTSEGALFKWTVKNPEHDELKRLETYLRSRAEQIVKDSVRRGQVDESREVAALAVDQSLTYHHIRPVIYALAAAGFSSYGFETRVLR